MALFKAVLCACGNTVEGGSPFHDVCRLNTFQIALGLAIVAEIMKAHHGSVSVDDNPGGGMIFTLRFGRAMSPAE